MARGTVLELLGSYGVPNLCPGSVKVSGNKLTFSEIKKEIPNQLSALVDACNEVPGKQTFNFSNY